MPIGLIGPQAASVSRQALDEPSGGVSLRSRDLALWLLIVTTAGPAPSLAGETSTRASVTLTEMLTGLGGRLLLA